MDIRTILETKESLEELTAEKLPLNAAIKLSKVQKELNSVLEIYQDRRRKLFEEMGEGEDLAIPESNREEFIKRHDDLIDEELDISIEQVSAEALGDIQISANSLTNLSWLLV